MPATPQPKRSYANILQSSIGAHFQHDPTWAAKKSFQSYGLQLLGTTTTFKGEPDRSQDGGAPTNNSAKGKKVSFTNATSTQFQDELNDDTLIAGIITSSLDKLSLAQNEPHTNAFVVDSEDSTT
ncbi:hypothetical protein Salat_2668300 [Sesamum alatum]|uniref:Uncharacterized protein n=1 Tax=Sesamum alatum TaxID=300844 RepID=A0AAE2CB02_9LAMI|nr:hypothetical protein Salat_2668300 [Sesamum alatum]